MRSIDRYMVAWVLVVLIVAGCTQPNPYGQGMLAYRKHCAGCHGTDGRGLEDLIPPLRQSDYLRNHQRQLPCLIRYGLDTPVVVNGRRFDLQRMPANEGLDDISIANIINFINNAWGNRQDYVPIDFVRERLKECDTDRSIKNEK